MIDSTLKELWETKDQIAREHDDDLDRLVEFLRRSSSSRRGDVSQPPARERSAPQGVQVGQPNARAQAND